LNRERRKVNGTADVPIIDRQSLGQIILVVQGSGVLGAYQVGVYEALCEAGFEPDWMIGASIGAINVSLIAGNAPEQRLPRLQEFLAAGHASAALAIDRDDGKRRFPAALTIFFKPNPWRFSACCP
jgi:predicted acylesterase/phospholipase RssA